VTDVTKDAREFRLPGDCVFSACRAKSQSKKDAHFSTALPTYWCCCPFVE